MADVFRAATAVYAWLGDLGPETHHALATLNRLRRWQQRPTGDNHQSRVNAQRRLLRLLADREYWTRIWIIQEVLLARSLWLMVDTTVIEWSTLWNVGRDFGFFLSEGAAAAKAFRWIWDYRSGRYQATVLRNLVQDFHGSQCLDPRDRIYGMLGLLSASDCSRACVDYNISLLQTIVNNVELLMPDTGHGIDPVHFYDIVWATCSKLPQGEVEDHSHVIRFLHLPQLQHEFSLRAKVNHSLRHTVACLHASDSGIVSFTHDKVSQQYDVYILLLRQGRPKGLLSSSIELYSTINPQTEDLILSLGSSYLIVRQHGEHFEVVGTAINVDCGFYNRSASERWIDPRAWMKTINPEARFTICGSPMINNAYEWDTFDWIVELDGAAVAQLAIVPYLRPGPRLRLDDALYGPIRSISETAVQNATGLMTQYKPNYDTESTISAASNMLPMYFQQPDFLPGLWRGGWSTMS